MSAFEIETFADGQVIFKLGDLANNLYFFKENQMGLLDAKDKVFDQIPQGPSFGEAAILNGRPQEHNSTR